MGGEVHLLATSSPGGLAQPMVKAKLAMARGDPGLSDVAFLCGDEALLPLPLTWLMG